MTEEEIAKLCMLVDRWNSNGVGRDNGIEPLELDSHLNLSNRNKAN
jgi:hypothetical protein